jgi:hypothetical protein
MKVEDCRGVAVGKRNYTGHSCCVQAWSQNIHS